MHLLAPKHPFVGGSNRTVLNTTGTFWNMSGCECDHGDNVRESLRQFATDQASVDIDAVTDYCREHTHMAEE